MSSIYPHQRGHWAKYEDEWCIIATIKTGTPGERQDLAEYTQWIFDRLGPQRKRTMWISINDWNGPYYDDLTQAELDAFADEFGFKKIWWYWNSDAETNYPGIGCQETIHKART